MTYEIQSNIPLPARRGRGRRCMYPFDKMKPGDSFDHHFTTDDPRERQKEYKRIYDAAMNYGNRNDKHFAVLQIHEQDEKLVRCWRESETTTNNIQKLY